MPYEDDIRAAFTALASHAPDSQRILTALQQPEAAEQRTSTRVGAPGTRRTRHGTRAWYRTRWLAALAAAAAVVAVIATAAAITGRQAPRSAAGSAAELAKVPRYYLTYDAAGHVAIRDTRTGATLAVLKPPSHSWFTGAAGAADDRTWVLKTNGPASAHGRGDTVQKLYLARFNPATRKLTSTPMSPAFSMSTDVMAFALSPNERELAVATQGSQTGQPAPKRYPVQIRLYSLTGGRVRIWQTQAPETLELDGISWGAHGILAVGWERLDDIGFWLLDTSTSGGSLLADSRVVIPGNSSHPYTAHGFQAERGGGLLSADGTTIVMPMLGNGSVAEFQEFSAETARPSRGPWSVDVGRGNVVNSSALCWSSPSAGVLVVGVVPQRNAMPEHALFGVLIGNRFTPIPGAPSVIVAGGVIIF